MSSKCNEDLCEEGVPPPQYQPVAPNIPVAISAAPPRVVPCPYFTGQEARVYFDHVVAVNTVHKKIVMVTGIPFTPATDRFERFLKELDAWHAYKLGGKWKEPPL